MTPGPPDHQTRPHQTDLHQTGPTRRPTYRPKHRLTHAKEFSAIYSARLKKPAGPLVVFALPNTYGHPRLGLSVGRRVGNAVARNAIKRRLRDAFRHIAAAWPPARPGLDIVIVARPHTARPRTDTRARSSQRSSAY